MSSIAQRLAQMDEEKRLYRLRHMVEEFIQAQKSEGAQRLLTSFDFIEMKIDALRLEDGVNQLLADYDRAIIVNKDIILLSLASAVPLSSTVLAQDAKQTFPQLYSRLLNDPTPALRVLLDAYKPSSGWLRMYSKNMISTESPLIRSLIGHEGAVSDCKLSNDGKMALSASSDRTLRIWDLETGLCKHILRGHTDEINACALSADGRLALSASTDKTLRLWDVERGECLRVLQEHTGKVTGCTLNEDGSLAVSSSYDQTIRVWDIRANTSFALSGHEERVTCRALDSTGRLVLSGSYDKTLRLWNIVTRECLTVIENEFGGITHCALSGDGQFALSKCILYLIEFENWDPETGDTPVSVFYNPDDKDLEDLKGDSEDDFFPALVRVILGTGITSDIFREDSIISVWNLSSGECMHRLGEELRSSISDFELDKDGKHVISSSSGDGSIRIWSLETGQCITGLFETTAGVSSCAMNSANNVAISSSNDGDLHVWRITGSPTDAGPTAQESAVSTIFACSYDQTGDIAISASSDKNFYLWNARTGEQISHTFTTDFRSTGGVTISVERRIALIEPTFLTPKEDREKNGPIVFDIQSGQVIRVLAGHSELLSVCTIDQTGRYIVSAYHDGACWLWNLEDGTRLYILEGHQERISCCALHANRQRVLSGSEDTTLRIWDMQTGLCVYVLQKHTKSVKNCCLSLDGHYGLSVGDDNLLCLWDIPTGTLVYHLKPAEELSSPCALNMDGRFMLYVTSDRTVRLLEVGTGQEVAAFTFDARVSSVAFSPDAMSIMVGDSSGRVHFLRIIEEAK